MTKVFKKLTAAAAVATMVMSMGATAFAANVDGSHDARLYKDGKFDVSAPDSNLSMGNSAVQDATITDNGNGTYTITVGLQEDFEAYFLTANMTAVSVNGTTAEMIDTDDNEKCDAFSFVYTGELTYPLQADANFTIDAGIMPMSAAGDLVIFE